MTDETLPMQMPPPAPLASLQPDRRPGWFGKLAGTGDFVSRRFDPALLSFCDGWLSSCMAAGQAQLAERWLEVYLEAPLLRFAWAPGVYDAYWWFGVLMPSCDNVGRYFPLLVAQRRSEPPSDGAALEHLQAWLEQLAETALQTLHDTTAIDDFEAALETLPEWPVPPPDVAAAGLAQQLATLAAERLLDSWLGHSVWQHRAPNAPLHLHAGLPDAGAWVGLLAAE